MILGFVEREDGAPAETSLEMLTLARELAGDGSSVGAVVFGSDGAAVADELGRYGVDDVYHVTHDQLGTYAPEAWGESIGQLVTERDPEAVLAPGTDRGHEVLSHVAAGLDLPMAANCLGVDAEETDDAGGSYELTRQRWGGSLVEHARLEAPTKLLTTAAHELSAEPAEATTEPTVDSFTPSLDDRHLRVRLDRVEESDEEGIPLGEARIVVGGGRGVGGPEDFDQLEELADLLGGAVGSSRAAVNEGWRPHDDQIGLTGAKISPDIYIACGISGAVQHMVGAKGSETILAINTDPEAAIVQKGDWAIIGNLHEVVPELNEAIRDAQ